MQILSCCQSFYYSLSLNCLVFSECFNCSQKLVTQNLSFFFFYIVQNLSYLLLSLVVIYISSIRALEILLIGTLLNHIFLTTKSNNSPQSTKGYFEACHEAFYQSLDEVTKISSKSRVEPSNTEDQSIVHRVVDSITEHKRQRYISED